MLALFFFLLSVVLYQKLSFDPYEILNLPQDADEKAIRKSYRKLSMIYHPDKNKTEEARVIYTSVRRAYKMLADPEAYEEELKNQPSNAGEVGVALPKFLMASENQRFAAPLLLGTLFLFPIALIWMLRGTENDEVLRQVIENLLWLQEQYDSFYLMMGEPEGCTNARPDDIIQAGWHVNETEFDVASSYVELCNESATRQINKLFPIIRQNKQAGYHFAQYRTSHENKQALLLQMKELCVTGEKPKKQMVASLQAFNKRIITTLEYFRPADGRMPMADGPIDMDDMPPTNRRELRARGKKGG